MDACLWVVVGSFIIHQVAALSCIECTHIIWNNTNRDLHVQQLGDQDVMSSWIGAVEKALQVKGRFNPACAAKDPIWYSEYNPSYTSDPTPQPIGTIVNQECPAFSEQDREMERCNYMHGNVEVYVKSHDKEIKLDVHVRNCGQADSASDYCADINTQTDSGQKAQDVANFFKNVLSFLGYGTDVLSFVGEQCLCTSSPCPRLPPTTTTTTSNPNAGTSNTVSVMATVLLAMSTVLVLYA